MAKSIVPKKPRITSTGLTVETSHCRRCRQAKSREKFIDATNTLLDTNGLLSVCNDCIEELFSNIYGYSGSIEATILKLCRMLDVAYVPAAIESAKKSMESKSNSGRVVNPSTLFGVYKHLAKVMSRTGLKDTMVDMSYREVSGGQETPKDPDKILDPNAFEGADDLLQFWGTDDINEISFLEREFANFKRTHKADTYAEIILMKEVCHKISEMDKARREGRSVDSMLKALQEVMKNLAISPNITNAASGNAVDSFGSWIKEIESTRPAEWVEDKSVFRDVDKLEEYSEKYITSPLRTFVTGNKEFDLDDGSFGEGFSEYEGEESVS
jgi:hypothetical protein